MHVHLCKGENVTICDFELCLLQIILMYFVPDFTYLYLSSYFKYIYLQNYSVKMILDSTEQI